jgi:glycine/D-amino acid oxidase-like deaminating enzyme
MIHDLYTSLTAREQRAIRWSAAATAAALWLSTAWADPRFLLIVPLAAAGFWLYRRRYRDEPAADDPDWDL